jgi:hypothetical protein
MSRGRKIALGVLVVVVFVATAGCSRWLDYFREKHPDPPPGAFPPRVGNMVIEVNERWGKNPNCTRADPLHCWAYYVIPGGDNEMTRTHYFMQIYDYPDEAKARMEEFSREQVPWEQTVSWEDGGESVGKLLIKNSIYRDGEQMLGVCSVSYTRNTWFITIFHGFECETPRQFYKDLIAITN